jgi:hypothetical protein
VDKRIERNERKERNVGLTKKEVMLAEKHNWIVIIFRNNWSGWEIW